jgi:hypothetical protein
MYKKIIGTSLIAASLFFAGCGDDSTNCRFDVQSDLDQGNFDAAINALDGSCKDSYTASDRYFNLASAYMGKSGYSAIDVVSMVLDTQDSNGSAFASLTKSVSQKKKNDTLELLSKAKNYFLLAAQPTLNAQNVTSAICNHSNDDTRIANSCFYVGFVQTFQATTTISYLTKDIDQLVDSIDNSANTDTPIDMKASLDALAWATGSTQLKNGSTITAKSIKIKNKAYKQLEVLQNGETFYRLANTLAPSLRGSTLVTDGYCDSNGEKSDCLSIENSDGSIDLTKANAAQCYACPVEIDNNATTVSNLLVDSLNSGTSVLSEVTNNDTDVRDSIDEFVQDITDDSNAKAGSVTITVEQVINYLNK